MEPQIDLQAGDYRLVLTPERGGSIARFDWCGEPLLRPTCGSSILDTACFPLVPFSNRIAFGRFEAGGREVRLAPNFPGADHPHTIHGFGWLVPWSVVSTGRDHAIVRHEYPGGEWPWPYLAEQAFRLSADGLHHSLSVQNLSTAPMPTGLGFHPYFPRTSRTTYRGMHKGEWRTAPDGLPLSLDLRASAVDWWSGAPAASRCVDTVYTERFGPLHVQWPERGIEVAMVPSDNLTFSVVFTPKDADFLCVEPVTHATNAIAAERARNDMQWLDAGGSLVVSVRYRARPLGRIGRLNERPESAI